MNRELLKFSLKFLKDGFKWSQVMRQDAIINFGNIISLNLYRCKPFQVELFIVPYDKSSFTEHKHPNVDVYEFHLTGDAMLSVNGIPICDHSLIEAWVEYKESSQLVPIPAGVLHSGVGYQPYAFLSIQQWLNDTEPTSVGLDWVGEPSSSEQAYMLNDNPSKMPGLLEVN